MISNVHATTARKAKGSQQPWRNETHLGPSHEQLLGRFPLLVLLVHARALALLRRERNTENQRMSDTRGKQMMSRYAQPTNSTNNAAPSSATAYSIGNTSGQGSKGN